MNKDDAMLRVTVTLCRDGSLSVLKERLVEISHGTEDLLVFGMLEIARQSITQQTKRAVLVQGKKP